jgi:hypothetical protein
MVRPFVAAFVLVIISIAQPARAEGPDFFFGIPRGWIGARSSWVAERASGDLFSFVRDQLTIGGSAFNRPTFGGQLGIRVKPRISFTADVDWGRSSTNSEYRHFIGTDQLPVSQTTALTQSNVSLSVRFDVTSAGQRISRLAWIPRRFVPFVGAGGGLSYYDFTQYGEFVDYTDRSIFRNTFDSTGWTPSGHLLAGADVEVWRKVYLTVEARYLWAHGDLGADFKGFDGIDLSGFHWTSGINVVF